MTRLGQATVDLIVHRRRSWLVALLLVLVAGGVIGAMKEATRTTSALDGLPVGAESTAVVEALQTFPKKEGSSAVVLYTAENGTFDDATVATLRTTLQGKIAGPLQVSQDKTAAIGIVPITATGNSGISTAVKELRTTLKASPPAGVTVQVTGPAAVQADLGAVFEGANTRLLLATASVVALLLLITYRSPVLWLVPLLVVGIADRLAAVLATHVLKAAGVAWDESTIGILSVLVFGAGTDYALLLISRYRDELRREPDRYAAMRYALRHTGEAVLLSATTVVLGGSPCCCLSSPARGGLASPALSALSWRRAMHWSCCPQSSSSSAAGCSGRSFPGLVRRRWSTSARSGVGSATRWPPDPEPS